MRPIGKQFVFSEVIYFLVFSSFPRADGQKRKKSLRRKLDSLAKEKSKDKGIGRVI